MNNKVKLVLTVLLLLLMIISGSGLAARPVLKIQIPPVAAALPILWMQENYMFGEEIDLELIISADHARALALIARGDIDLMVTGDNVGAKAFNNGIDIKHLSTSVWGVDYLLTNGFKADNWSDLKGKKLALPLKGGPLDFLARYLLINNGVNPDEVELVYLPLSNGARLFQLGQVDAIILPEPLVTVSLKNNQNARLSFDIQKEWANFHDGDPRIPFVGLFVRGNLARENKLMIERFNYLYGEGVEWVNENPAKAAALGAKYFNMPARLIEASFQRINLKQFPEGESFYLIETFFGEIMEMYPEMIGGRLPNEYFYF